MKEKLIELINICLNNPLFYKNNDGGENIQLGYMTSYGYYVMGNNEYLKKNIEIYTDNKQIIDKIRKIENFNNDEYYYETKTKIEIFFRDLPSITITHKSELVQEINKTYEHKKTHRWKFWKDELININYTIKEFKPSFQIQSDYRIFDITEDQFNEFHRIYEHNKETLSLKNFNDKINQRIHTYKNYDGKK